MYSNSQSYLGGSNSGRPGIPSYGQQSFGQPSAPSPFSAQPSGYGAGMPQLQPQATGYPGQMQPQATGYPGQMQSQATGYPGQGQYQNQNNSFGQQPLQAQSTGYPGQGVQQFQPQQPPQPPQPPQQAAPSAQRLQSQPTGMTSAQMADSFRSSPAQTTSRVQPAATAAIPKIRLSFITATDQTKFETLFRSAVGNNQVMSGDQARDLLLRSKLPGDTLSQIWYAAQA